VHHARQAERRKTILIVTVAVILVVAAVLIGAYILRHKIQVDNALGAAGSGRTAVMAVPGALPS
jgi:hypothetical protein